MMRVFPSCHKPIGLSARPSVHPVPRRATLATCGPALSGCRCPGEGLLLLVEWRELRHDLAPKQRQRTHFLRMRERAERQEQHEIALFDALGLGEEDARDGLRTAH